MQRVSPLYADGKIYTCDVNGRWTVLKPTKEGVQVVHQMRLSGGGEVHASPIVSHGRLYVQTTEFLYCIGKADHKPTADPIPPQPEEKPVGDDTKPARIQIVPCEALIRPGEKVAFETRVYNANGRLLDSQKVEYACTKGAKISSSGSFETEAGSEHKAVTVSAKLGELKSDGRVRIVPDLPWAFDFADGVVPITWVGAAYRYVIKPIDGKPTMVKVTTIPKGTRSQAWMGHTDFHDYTIEADMKGGSINGKMPDMGLIAQRGRRYCGWPRPSRSHGSPMSGTRSSCGPRTPARRRSSVAKYGRRASRSRPSGKSSPRTMHRT
jgi:hypothetical protein